MSVVFNQHPEPDPWPIIRSRVKYRWTVPFYFADWLGDCLAYRLSRWSLLAVLEYLGTLSLLLAVVSYFSEAHGRLEQKHYQAWQVINTAQGKGGSGGRIDALQNLNDDRVPLVGVDLSGAFLQRLRLPVADLRRSTMRGTDLLGATFAGANLTDSTLASSNFRRADLHHATLTSADLQNVDLNQGNLVDADVDQADFGEADLRDTDLAGLKHWDRIANLRLANVAGAKNAPEGFLTWAAANGAVSLADDADWAAAIQWLEADTPP